MKIGISNSKSSIAQEFAHIIAEGRLAGEIDGVSSTATVEEMPVYLDRYLICDGFLAGQDMESISEPDFVKTFSANFATIVQFCDKVFDVNPWARVCIIGSESGISGSFDQNYAAAKRAIHDYIERKSLTSPGQQLVGIAPTIIEDSGMTQRRADLKAVIERGAARRRGAWLQAIDVAKLAHFAIFEDSGNLCNTIIRMNGGNW